MNVLPNHPAKGKSRRICHSRAACVMLCVATLRIGLPDLEKNVLNRYP